MLCQSLTAFSLGNPIQGRLFVKKKRKLFQESLAGVSELVCVTHVSSSQRQEFQPDSLSFRAVERLIEDLTRNLGPRNPDQLLFSGNPSPLRPPTFPIGYLLLPPRSALDVVPPRLTP